MQNRPLKRCIMYQEWRNLLFLHWKYDKEEIQKTLPKGLYVDTFNGYAYITIVPFFIQNLKVSILPRLPFLSDFIEVNVRTYVHDRNGIPGVWFYSLDINSLIATTFARQFFYLPYNNAKLLSEITIRKMIISGSRHNKTKADMMFKFYPIKSKAVMACTDSLDFFLLERYALFTARANKLYMEQIHHSPYLLSNVDLIDYNSTLLEANHLRSPHRNPEIVHFCSALDVDFFQLEKII